MHPTAINARTGRATVMFWIEDRPKKNTGVALKPRKGDNWGSTIHEIDDVELYETKYCIQFSYSKSSPNWKN